MQGELIRERDLTDGLMDQTATLFRLRDELDQLIARNRRLTRAALIMEQRRRKNGNPAKAEEVRTSDVSASNVAD